jgi:hypothetical protein
MFAVTLPAVFQAWSLSYPNMPHPQAQDETPATPTTQMERAASGIQRAHNQGPT